MAQGQNLLPHSDTRRGFSTHNSIGTDNLSNPNMPSVTCVDGTVGDFQPGMIELKEANGTPYYLWVDSSGNLRINASIPTTPDTDGVPLGSATQAAAIADYGVTWTLNEPAAGSTATIADGTIVGDNNEGGQAIADLTAKVNLILAALRSNGVIAT
jgi:hypothetical protein